jgi:hypothetical protein
MHMVLATCGICQFHDAHTRRSHAGAKLRCENGGRSVDHVRTMRDKRCRDVPTCVGGFHAMMIVVYPKYSACFSVH